jgi:hypothetical protein
MQRAVAQWETRSLGLGPALAVVKIVVRVIGRIINRSDHGFHTTVVEEVFRGSISGDRPGRMEQDQSVTPQKRFRRPRRTPRGFR